LTNELRREKKEEIKTKEECDFIKIEGAQRAAGDQQA